MKTVVRINFDSSDIPGGAQTILGMASCGPDVATVQDTPVLGQVPVWVTLERTDPRLPVLRQLLDQYGQGTAEFHEDRFTEEEFDRARLLLMQPNRECEIDGGVKWGMTYDLSQACRACGTGGSQTSAVFVNGEELGELQGRHAGATWHWHYLVDDALASDLERIGASGLFFRSVYAVMPDKRQVKLRWKQVCAKKTAPRMAPSSTGFTRERPCPVCGRNGYFGMNEEPTRPVYRAVDLLDADDIQMTWENVGYGVLEPELRDSLLSKPWMLVTPKIRRIFRDAGVTAFDWLPIRIEGTDG